MIDSAGCAEEEKGNQRPLQEAAGRVEREEDEDEDADQREKRRSGWRR
jgi:hypothetical protein